MNGCREGAKDCIPIGMIGLGTVGSGVFTILEERGDLLARRIGRPVYVKKILVKDPRKKRDVVLPEGVLTTNPADVLDDPEIPIVVEVMGGTTTARSYLLRAANHGKHIITANKALLAERGGEVLSACARHHVDLGFEASVCGGIPIIRTMREGLSGDDIEFLYAIVNGTSNYILTRMSEAGLDFAAALAEAQAQGFAETDPTLDVDGTDAAHKLAILAAIAYGVRVDFPTVPHAGIAALRPVDFEMARRLGYRIKLLAILERRGARIEARVLPAMIPQRYLLASVEGAHNAVYLRGKAVGPLMLYGRGAGRGPTANSIVADLVEIARNLALGVRRRVHPYSFRDETLRPAKILPLGDRVGKTYLRMIVVDQPGVIAQIARIIGQQRISIHSTLLAGNKLGDQVPMVFLLHDAPYRAIERAVKRIDALKVVRDKTLVLFIEDRQVRA
jgi:homoserine dehydrogenase